MSEIDSMIERVAKGIWGARIEPGGPGRTLMPWPLCPEADWCRATAKAAIEAMREPTLDMVEAGQEQNNLSEFADIPNHFEFLSRDEMTNAWQAMIDTALKTT